MIEKQVLVERLQSYLLGQINKMAKSHPLIGLVKPLATRAVSKNFNKVGKWVDLIADENGMVDIDSIMSEMMESLMGTDPFSVDTGFLGRIQIGGGSVKFNIPMTDQILMLNESDIKEFVSLLTSK